MLIGALAASGLFILAVAARADVTLPAIFGGNMVLQQDAKIPVWGWADPGELVQVSFGDQQLRTQADEKGNWRVEFPPMPASDKPQTLAVAGRSAIQFDNILVGELWLVVGDSSPIHDEPNANDILAQVNDPLLHFYEVGQRPGIRPKTIGGGYWHPCAQPWIPNTSSLAYFFGQQLRQNLNRPIGIITAPVCGQPIEGFLSRESLQKIPGNEKPLADIAVREATFPHDPVQQRAAVDDWGKRINDWQTNQNVPWMRAENAWSKARDAAIAAKQQVPPEPPRRPEPPKNPDGESGDVTVFYNGLIAPLTGFPIHGIVWSQGQNNGGDTQPQYEAKLRALIGDWRTAWKSDPDFVVLGLQTDGQRAPNPTNSGWAEVRGAQITVAASETKSALAPTLDLGPSRPGRQLDVGKRLVATTLHLAYGQNVPFEGPRFAGITVEGNKIRVKYANADVGFTLAAQPYTTNDANYPPLPISEPLGFEVAGADKKWVTAKAQIDGNTMLVWGDAVAAPVAVRYAWSTNPPVNLYSKDGFPAAPFRTQDWPVTP